MSEMMKALVKAKPQEGLWLERVPVPDPGPRDVLIKVRKSAICGTDVHIWKWDDWSAKTVPVPMVVGHEFCGEIAARGSAATKFTSFAGSAAIAAPAGDTCAEIPAAWA